ncbi:hypothetical protein Zm00014a_026601 [Zea mays]|uniref:Cyclin/Brf1-like TBP-binding protein n=2 Tax=Zea mays TaxID=4577 RepID=A0A1D6I894_MAIZE|nr:Cyclin/Brf1-like TBP-binding protein [Zea mays]PWZ15614.1 hypothetical protein Zm00014a_026601 [Zea mays]
MHKSESPSSLQTPIGFVYGENCEGNADPESLSDIDDAEADGYLHNEEETQYKKIIWEEMNKEYLEEQAAKEALAAELAATGIDPEAGKKVRNNLGRPNFLFNFGN